MKPPRSLPLPARPGAATGGLYLAAYVALDALSYVDPLGPLGITPWNPPPGLSLFLLLRYGMRMAPWLLAATLAAQLLVRGLTVPWWLIAVLCTVLAGGYTAMGAVMRHRLAGREAIASLRDAALFAAIVVPSTCVIAVAYVGLAWLGGVVAGDAFVASLTHFWIGDTIGIVVTTPLLLAWAGADAGAPRVGRFEKAAQFASILVTLWIVFGAGGVVEVKLFYLLFVPLVWIAVRGGVRTTATATFVIQIGLIAALVFIGHEAGVVRDFQFLMLTLAFTGLFLAVAVEERRRMDQRLRDKQFELERTLRAAAMGEVASTLAHELNQPLSAVATYARSCQLLLAGGERSEELAATMDNVVREAQRAAAVVRRLRELVRSGAVQREAIAPHDLLRAAADTVRSRAARHGIVVATQAQESLPDVFGDRIQLEMVLLNLVNNAMDALSSWDAERLVRVAADRAGGVGVRFTVSDTGPGIAATQQPQLFMPLATTKPHGMGLGLAICRTIVEAHGGRIAAGDAAQGAVFVVTLPAAS
jgi:signal transduction histidine kinase